MATRYGNALLALNTLRAPDKTRGIDIPHLTLALPGAIQSQVAAWEAGGRGAVDPREAANILWTTPAAAHLTGATNAWRAIAGVDILCIAKDLLVNEDPEDWPTSQAELRKFVAHAAPAQETWAALSKRMATAGTLGLLNDIVLIFKYAALGTRRPLRDAAEAYRLLRALVDDEGPETVEDVVAWMNAPLVVQRPLSGPLSQRGPQPPPPGQPPPRRPVVGPRFDFASPAVNHALERLRSHLDDVERANTATRVSSVLREAGISDGAVIARAVRDVGELRDGGRVVGPRADAAERFLPPVPVAPKASHLVRTHLFGAAVTLDLGEVDTRRARERSKLAHAIFAALPADVRNRIGQAGIAVEDLPVWDDLLHVVTPTPSYLEPVGRNDLLLVRQTTTGYRRAEIAYIENVMVGEHRSREHKQRTLTRQEFTETIERESEETRDLQVSDKASLSREVSKVVEEDLRTEGSVQVTSRGPTKVVASAGVSYERSTEEAAKSAEEYARETIERAVKRTLDRMKRESKSLFEQETIEENHHGFERESDAADHVSGVYQYLERVSRAKLFWYGEREVYDLLIPEPAALIWQLATTHKQLQLPIEAPDPDLFASLTLDNIADKREEVIRAYRVTDIPPYPAPNLEVAASFSATGPGGSSKYAYNKELQVPEGYEVTDALFAVSAEVEDSDDIPNGGISVGGQVELWMIAITSTSNLGGATRNFQFAVPLRGPSVGIAMNADNYTSLSGTVTLQLRLVEATKRQWAITAYGRVAERYEQLRREYAQAVIQATASQGAATVELPSGARQWLQQIVRAELQRSAIDLMRNAPVDYRLIEPYAYAMANGSLGTQPVADATALRAAEPEIRFLQQAFEWEHLAWILYPYFWGRRGEWTRTVVTNHPDPDFAAFLNAGAARLQIPVRPGFEAMVKHFMETLEVYEGDGMPKLGDEGYVTFIDEQMTSLGAPGDEVPWPPHAPREWDIVAPTSLLLVRTLADSQLPTWDPYTGAEL